MGDVAATIEENPTAKKPRSLRIVLTTLGSLGDLHPYIAVALELKTRGHRPAIATSSLYREKVEALGIDFFPLRPEFPAPEEKREIIDRLMHPTKGPERVIREWVIPNFRETYADIDVAAQGADLLVSHPLTFGTRVVAEHRGLPWASSLLAPVSFMSAYDASLVPFPGIKFFRKLGPTFMRSLMNAGQRHINPWFQPIHQLRAELGLPFNPHPLFAGQHSPDLVLAMYSEVLGASQPDWPESALLTGFAFYDKHKVTEVSRELAAFLDAGPPPIVFTLGSSAVINPGDFYSESAKAAEQLGQRAVLLVGPEVLKSTPLNLPQGVVTFDYAPYSELFPRAIVIVHQGGVGTTGQALRAGRPTLIVPFAHDQPDNADRVQRLGVSRTLARHRYTAERAGAELKQLLEVPSYATKAREIGRKVQGERGAERAAEALVTLGSRDITQRKVTAS